MSLIGPLCAHPSINSVLGTYKSRANKAIEALKAAGIDAKVSSAKPRRGAFNFTVKSGDKETEVWDGLKKGPPRADKFPDLEELVEMCKAAA